VDVCQLIPCHPASKNEEILIITPNFKTPQKEDLFGVYKLYECKVAKEQVVISLGRGKKRAVDFRHVIVVQMQDR
jgi:hypothetical protein